MPEPLNLPDAPDSRRRAAASCLVAIAIFAAYHATLLPSLDFGDTAAYQGAVGDWHPTPRQAYPLYFALANTLFAVVGGEPARALNLLSALCGAAAGGAVVWLAAGLTGSIVAGVWAGLMLGASYTFWSQAIIGEVYTLHLLLTALTLIAAFGWARQPSLSRLALLFGVYAISFGNHLMMILLAPALLVLLALTPGGLRQAGSPRALGLALLCAVAGGSQYLWNAAYLWQMIDPPPPLLDGFRTFWFDVTKSDWRSTMVMGVHESALPKRADLYWFDITQQFGVAGVCVALAGVAMLWRRWRLLLVLLTGWLTAFVFAYTYNVGDVHVFFLPSHQLAVLSGAFAIAALLRWTGHRRAAIHGLALAVTLLWPAWRAWDTWPAVDRHDDQRARAWLDGLTAGFGADALLFADVNWQRENGLAYYTRHIRPDLLVASASSRILTLPWLVADNLEAGRAVAMTPESRRVAEAAYGRLFDFDADPQAAPQDLASRLELEAPGTLYVLSQLAPYRDLPYDAGEAAAAAQLLTGGAATLGNGPSYQVLAGRVGERPLVDRRTDRPFRARLVVDGIALDLRMESWLPADTIRRAGFGHVIANRRHVLTLERGISVVLLAPDGSVRQRAYASGLFAPLARVRVGMRRPGETAMLGLRGF